MITVSSEVKMGTREEHVDTSIEGATRHFMPHTIVTESTMFVALVVFPHVWI